MCCCVDVMCDLRSLPLVGTLIGQQPPVMWSYHTWNWKMHQEIKIMGELQALTGILILRYSKLINKIFFPMIYLLCTNFRGYNSTIGTFNLAWSGCGGCQVCHMRHMVTVETWSPAPHSNHPRYSGPQKYAGNQKLTSSYFSLARAVESHKILKNLSCTNKLMWKQIIFHIFIFLIVNCSKVHYFVHSCD